jgi:ATP synthase I chain
LTDSLPVDSPTGGFYSGALGRIRRIMAGLTIVLTPAAWWKLGWHAALGFALGCALAYLNFGWLERVIAGFVDRASGAETKKSTKGIVLRFLLRYVLMGLGAYVILTVSPASLNGLFAGLFLPVAAILCEAAYEVYAAMTYGV